jgi:hypothetical protein
MMICVLMHMETNEKIRINNRFKYILTSFQTAEKKVTAELAVNYSTLVKRDGLSVSKIT